MQHISKKILHTWAKNLNQSHTPQPACLRVHLNVRTLVISQCVMSEAASRVIPLLCGAALPRGLQQHECELRAALETRKVALFLDGCLGFV